MRCERPKPIEAFVNAEGISLMRLANRFSGRKRDNAAFACVFLCK